MSFNIKSEELIDYTLALQKVSSVALPFAVQNAFNDVVKNVKEKTLEQSTSEMFDVQKKNFFKANSGYEAHKPKDFNYNLNKLKAGAGIIKSNKPNEKATEQLESHESNQTIDRSINPLGNRPQTTRVIDILSKKPEIIVYSESNPDSNYHYIRGAARARKRNASLVITNSKGVGHVYEVRKFKSRKPTKKDPRNSIIKLKTLATYHHDGTVQIRRRSMFMPNALNRSANAILKDSFIKNANIQINKIWQKK
jgi:hypothetical protein